MEDEEIYQLYWKRNEQAITATHEKYGGWCQGIAYRILNAREESEECVSDTYFTVWNRIAPPEAPDFPRLAGENHPESGSGFGTAISPPKSGAAPKRPWPWRS